MSYVKYLFNLSIVKRIFPDDLKIAKVTSIYKADNRSNVSNYNYAIAQLVDQIYEAFEKNEYTLGVCLICPKLLILLIIQYY